jgi:hypothetical protein
LEDWLRRSPDLNPIENRSTIMKHGVSEVGTTTIEEMEQVTIIVWQGLQPEELQNLASSMTNLLQATTDSRGGPNGY